MNAGSAILVGVILFACCFISFIEWRSESRTLKRLTGEAVFRWKDSSAEEIRAAYTRARIREEELLDNRYEYSSRNTLEVEALIDGLEEIALAKGFKLPTDDEILREYNEEHT